MFPKDILRNLGNYSYYPNAFEELGELFLFPKHLLRIMGNCSRSPTYLGNMGNVPQSSREHVSLENCVPFSTRVFVFLMDAATVCLELRHLKKNANVAILATATLNGSFLARR